MCLCPCQQIVSQTMTFSSKYAQRGFFLHFDVDFFASQIKTQSIISQVFLSLSYCTTTNYRIIIIYCPCKKCLSPSLPRWTNHQVQVYNGEKKPKQFFFPHAGNGWFHACLMSQIRNSGFLYYQLTAPTWHHKFKSVTDEISTVKNRWALVPGNLECVLQNITEYLAHYWMYFVICCS